MGEVENMKDTKTKEHIARIAKASTYFIFRNGPVNKLHKENKVSELVMNTMNQFYVNDDTEVVLADEGFDSLYDQLFPKSSNIILK